MNESVGKVVAPPHTMHEWRKWSWNTWHPKHDNSICGWERSHLSQRVWVGHNKTGSRKRIKCSHVYFKKKLWIRFRKGKNSSVAMILFISSATRQLLAGSWNTVTDMWVWIRWLHWTVTAMIHSQVGTHAHFQTQTLWNTTTDDMHLKHDTSLLTTVLTIYYSDLMLSEVCRLQS